jgi:hypothetical protein
MFHLNNIKMKKVLMMACGAAMFGMATLAQAQDQDKSSTDYNNPPVEQQDQSTLPTQDQPIQDQPTQDPALDQPTQDPNLNQPTQEPPVQDPALDRPTQDPALDQPTQDQPVDDGTNAIPQGQSRESEQPTQDQTDQATDPSISTDPTMERPSEITPVEGKTGPNGEAVFMENGKHYYMNDAGEKTKIKKSELQDKVQ